MQTGRTRTIVTALFLVLSTITLSMQGPWTTPPGSSGKVRIVSTSVDALCVGGAAVAPAAGACTGGVYTGTLTVNTSSNLGLTQTFRGLRLRTHTDADQAANKISLLGADEILTDRGTRVTPRTLSADITSSGAGGLDTGSRVASTWYEAYYIFKGLTASSPDSPTAPAADALLLHRAKDRFSDSGQQFNGTVDASRALRRATGTATDLLAEGFKTATSGAPGKVEFVLVSLIRAGAVSGRVWLEIRSDTAGSPSSTVLATSDKLDASLITTTAGGQFVAFVFRTPFTTADTTTQYHLVLNGDYTRSDTVNIAWQGLAAGGYANGVAKEFNAATWANASGVGDFLFFVWTTRNDTAVTMPTGYTEKCKIGYVYNSSGNALVYFNQQDRHVRVTPVLTVSAGTGAVPTVFDATATLPPGSVMFDGEVVGSTAAEVWVLSDIPDGIGGNTGGFVTTTVPANNAPSTPPPVLTEFQAFYYSRLTGANTLNFFLTGYRW